MLTALLLTTAGFSSLAQTPPNKVGGTIKDDKGQFLEAVTVTLLKAADSSRLRVTVTGKTGHFGFAEVPAGKYLILASSVGYNKLYSLSFEVPGGQVVRTLPPLVLTPSIDLLLMIIGWWMFYLMGTALENFWGTFRFNLFLLTGFLLAAAVSTPLAGRLGRRRPPVSAV